MFVKYVNDKHGVTATARDDEIAKQWAFHDFIIGAKTQVNAQYGDSSNEIQALGLKKKSEYKSPAKKKNGIPWMGGSQRVNWGC